MTRALGRGIPKSTVQPAMAQADYLPAVLDRDRNQFQRRRTLEDYIAITTSDDRVSNGQSMLRRHRALLDALEAKYGVPPEITTAIWGTESRYGQRLGDYPAISALATLGFASRRAGFFEGQLVGALRILAAGDVRQRDMISSWAGAMGHTQFIPTTYLAYAVDFDGDGRRNVWESDPTDALASAAHYLNRSGWQQGGAWGVTVPPGQSRSGMIRPQAGGPGFIRTQNFRTLLRYNNSDNYVIAVGALADRLAGKPGLQSSFPPDAHGLTLSDRKDLQKALARRGYEMGAIDGVLGPKTEAALRDFQGKRGLAVTGTPTPELLRLLG